MRMMLLSPLLLLSTPVFAQQRHAPPPIDAHDAARLLSNPMVQGAIAGLVTNLTDAVMDTHVGPLADLTTPDADIRPSDTLGDLAARRDPDFRRHVFDRTQRAVAGTGRAVGDVAAMSDELAATTARVRRILDATARAAQREGYGR